MKSRALLFSIFVSSLMVGTVVLAQCQHPYCNGPVGSQANSPAAADKLKAKLIQVGVERFTASNYKPGIVRHIVIFRYLPTVTGAQKQKVISRFLALKNIAKRDGKNYIVSIEAGSEISGEGADQAFEQGFIVTFQSQGDRNYYVGMPVVALTDREGNPQFDPIHSDPAHQAFKSFVEPYLDKDATGTVNGAFVFDFAL